MTPEDLRAAVQAGIVTEAQAASLATLAQTRAGQRAAQIPEDEPFEFFKGFAEIFISLGLVILLGGVSALLALMGGGTTLVALPLICAAIAWWWAGYFTLKRRMNLPSMLLALTFGVGIFLAALTAFVQFDQGLIPSRMSFLGPCVIAALAMILWYRRFRLPFSAFVAGVFVAMSGYAATASVGEMVRMYTGVEVAGTVFGIFDLFKSPVFAATTLCFGLGAFALAMWFDLKDPHRLGRASATAFWLHLLAAPALVNTLGMTLSGQGGSGAMLGLAVGLLLITLLALVVDRRSFLTAGIAYIAVVLFWFMGERAGVFSYALRLIVLGALITALGTWWVQLRALLMTALPDFPGKDRLPPYSRP